MDRSVSTSPPVVEPSPPVSEPPAPEQQAAPLSRGRRFLKFIVLGLPRLRNYVLALAVTIGVLYQGMRLGEADMEAPFLYEADALLILPLVKATVERGSHWRNPRLGAPGIQELHDFPIVDHLHFAIIWIIGQFVHDPVLTFNLFYLLTYPLTTLIGMYVLRSFGLSMPASICGSLLFAFQPYHYFRSVAHYFLSAYFIIPLSLMVTLWICRGTLPFYPQDVSGHRQWRFWDRRGWAAVLICVLTGSAGAYYAYFACALLAAASFYGWAALGTWRAALSGWFMIVLIALTGVANHAPTFGQQARTGANTKPSLRYSEEAEIYGMKVTQLLLPVAKHNYQPLAALQSEYESPRFRPLQNENKFDSLGFVAAIALCGLLVSAFLPYHRRWPIGPLAALTLFAVLLGTVGGLGAIFNHLVTPQVRAYNRISIYIAFLALFAACWTIDRVLSHRQFTRRLLWPVFIAVTAFGLWDQLNLDWFAHQGQIDQRERAAERFWDDRYYFKKIESLMPAGAAIFNYPHVSYPEASPVVGVESYDHVRGYLHTDSLRWSYGSMSGRQWDYHCRDLMNETPPQFFERLVLLGFDGLLIDLRGFSPPKKYEALHFELERCVGHIKPLVHHDGTLVFYDLSGYAKQLRDSYGKHTFDDMARKERERIVPMWLKGFFSGDRVYYGRSDALLMLLNPSDRPRTVRISSDLGTLVKEPTTLTITGPGWTDKLVVSDANQPYTREILLQPGYTKIHFHCPPPPSYLPADSRNLIILVSNFRKTDTTVPDANGGR